jgi:hypothetical protein
MSRIIHESGDVQSAAYSPETRLQYIPGTQQGQVIFGCERHTTLNGRTLERVREPDLILPLSECLQREYTITLPDGTQQTHAGLIVMLLVQQAFHEHYEAREALAAEVEAGEPAPATELPAPTEPTE